MVVTDTVIYGARSGIQKAIRRGEPTLAKTCFDILWDVPAHKKWLLWRLPVLVFEDCWTMAGELAEVQQSVRSLSDSDKKKEWLKFLIRLTIANKNQDASHLWYLALHGGMDFDHKEYGLMESLAEKAGRSKPDKIPYFVVMDFLKNETGIELGEYEEAACKTIDARRTSGGMVSDQWNALAAILLVHTRRLPKEEILQMLDKQKQVYKDEKIGKLSALPIYCFDMHTRPGMLAKRVFLKNHKTKLMFDEDHLDTLWFQAESAMIGTRVKPPHFVLSKNSRPSWKESMWEESKLESLARWYGVSISEMLKHWEQNRQKMFDIVEWAIKKQEK